ncbi:OmcA/MtrC family decaheme c-type cytochrome [Shewanella maritima]|uniref:OmcA/MtrC family decaheme c-type cytochrome n=1 Tax=Shewanella maritima TaxID=2520507 RepID=UPI003735D93D
MSKYRKSIMALAIVSAISLSACSGDDGKDGKDGEPGAPGQPGDPGLPAGSFATTVESAADYQLTVSPTDIVVVGSNDFALKFTVTGKNPQGEDVPFMGLDKIALYVMNQYENTTDTGAPILWQSHTLTNEFGSSMYCTPTGKATARGGAEVDACTLVEDLENPGTYTGTWEHDGNAPVVLADGDVNDLYRVMIRSYDITDAEGNGVADKLLSTPIDFIAATGEAAVSAKDAVSNETCIKCHTQLDGYAETDMRISNIHAHHNYQKVENCVACHNPAYAGGQDDPEKGYNANWNAMIHTLHAGHHIDNLQGEAKEMFAEIGFPSEINECTACHDNGTQWNDNIYAEACVSCHTDVNFETGENHAGITPSSDAACVGCHGGGSLSPVQAHKVGVREKAVNAIVVDVSHVSYMESATADMDEITVTFDVSVDGQPVEDGFEFTNFTKYDEMKIGRIEDDGRYFGSTSVNLNGIAAVGGQITVTKPAEYNLDGASISITPRFSVCADADGMLIECLDATGNAQYDIGYVAITMAQAYWNLANPDGSDANISRFSDPARVTADEAKCNTCHTSLGIAKHYGDQRFDQCVGCHNDTWGGSYHVTVEYKSDEVDTDGNPIFKEIDGLTYHTRDLFAVAHRFHTGLWDDNRGFPAIHLNSDMETVGYPAVATQCTACHKDDVSLFASDGGLTSGKRAIAVDAGATEFISPVAEACRTCHAHSNASALAHFRANGAVVEGEGQATSDLPVESCATCHAEGKTYGIDVVHGGGAH